MNCENCYKNGHCWACVKWFGCSKPSREADCFKCARENCQKEVEANHEQ